MKQLTDLVSTSSKPSSILEDPCRVRFQCIIEFAVRSGVESNADKQKPLGKLSLLIPLPLFPILIPVSENNV